MASRVARFKPANRHLLILPCTKKNETATGVLLPENYKPEENRYIEARVIDIASDCNSQFKHFKYERISDDKKIIVDRAMIQEVNLQDKTHYLILENYVVGLYKDPNED
jgi:co-chaperonin GroES (HSP10)